MTKEQFLERASVCIAGNAEDLRAKGFAVAVHNDYRQGGKKMTFWVVTREGPDGIEAFKGEGETDADALGLIRAKVAQKYDKLKHAPMCPANHYCGQRAPSGPCNCGAAVLVDE